MTEDPVVSREEEVGRVTTAPNSGTVWRFTAIAAGVSLIVNVIIFIIGRSAGWIPHDMPEQTEAFSIVSVVLASVLPVLAFGGLMVYLDRVAPRASRLFAIVLLVVLLMAVMVPFVLRDIDGSFRNVLVAMHVVTAASIYSLTMTTPR